MAAKSGLWSGPPRASAPQRAGRAELWTVEADAQHASTVPAADVGLTAAEDSQHGPGAHVNAPAVYETAIRSRTAIATLCIMADLTPYRRHLAIRDIQSAGLPPRHVSGAGAYWFSWAC